MCSFDCHQSNGEKMGPLAILPFIHTATVGTMLNFNGGNDGHGLKTLRVNKTLNQSSSNSMKSSSVMFDEKLIIVTGSASASACAVVHYRLITYATYMRIQAPPCTSRHRCCQSNSMQFPYKRQSFCHRSSLQT